MSALAARRDDLFNYADDIAVYVASRTHVETKRLLREKYEEVSSWLTSQGLTADRDKTEVLFFRAQKKPEEVDLGNGLVAWAGPTLKWLGVTLSCRLDFKAHAEAVSKKAVKVVGLLSRVSKVY
jgi:hypothetical protein